MLLRSVSAGPLRRSTPIICAETHEYQWPLWPLPARQPIC
jgi:hypothetical protein